ncbi:extracellular catalytic domain type 1 short-chain-length polyhydroxyalkanoate depolymerase [Marinimicrobium locisalis]|uniref:extracellular catalytic domain type 1 short-chain-length polyhydroxyalkanoate depolymerase n=1 Tax=Marinimicrobium locisalis TaxID=546022 RepID=UPI003221F534
MNTRNAVTTGFICAVLSLFLTACGGSGADSAPEASSSSSASSQSESSESSSSASESSSSSSDEAISGELFEVSDFGDNPSDLDMHLYVPESLQNNAPVLLAVHYCTGTGPEFYQNTSYNTLADSHGFIVIYPTATRSSKCFDVASSEALTRDGGSDPVGLRSMIGYVESHYNVDAGRIFVTGVSSGAMMTNVMLALYPDVFKAGAFFAGVPYTCFATTGDSEWNSECANGNVSKTAEEWGDLVRNAYPDFGGERPRVQLWHGTADDVLHYNNFDEAIKQWTDVHGLSQTPDYTDEPSEGATRTRYGDSGSAAPVEAISLEGVGHNLPVDENEVIRFFGLDGGS